MISRLPLSASLLLAVSVQVLCQLFKAVFYSLRERKFVPRYLLAAGGMPSSHSAFVTALSVSVGISSGFGSDLFAVCCVFSAIVIYDAWRLRGTVERHARVLKSLAERAPALDSSGITDFVGHSPAEIAVGIAAGGGAAALASLVIFRS